jgi:DNA invertase Pin-like site-specific DNA recombinase
VIGERVRDKIAASKRKGIWVGGPVPLGYRCIDKKLVVLPQEVATVRAIFTQYLELGSMGALIARISWIMFFVGDQTGGGLRSSRSFLSWPALSLPSFR